MTFREIIRSELSVEELEFFGDKMGNLYDIMRAYADQETSSLSTQLTEMTAEKNRWFDKYTIESQRVDILDGELRITQKKLEVLAGMLDK